MTLVMRATWPRQSVVPGTKVNIYKRLFLFKALLWESIVLLWSPSPAKPTLLQY